MPSRVHDISEAELLSRCLSNEDSGAWELFVRNYAKLIWSAIHKTFRSTSFGYSSQDAEEVFNTIFLSLVDDNFKKLRQFQSRNSSTLSTWLSVVTIHKTIDYMRMQHRGRVSSIEDHEGLAETLADNTQTIETVLIKKQQLDALAKTLSTLPSQDKAIFDLLYVRNLSPDAAARELGISLAAFYTRKHRLVEKIKDSQSL